MNTSLVKTLWLTARIWLVAVMINTVLGTLYLSDFTFDANTTTIFFVGLVWGIPFSLPAAIVIMIVMNRRLKAGINGLQLLRSVFITGILMSIIVYAIFIAVIGITSENWVVVLLGVAVLSGIMAITAHRRIILKLDNNYKNHSGKN